MKRQLLVLVLIILVGFVFCQYELRESYYGSGGPVGATGGAYNLWGSATAQTAVNIVTGGAYVEEQGFYHREKMYFVYFCARDYQRAYANDPDSISIWGDTLFVVVHYLNRGIWKADTIGILSDTVAVWVDSVQSHANYWYEKLAIFHDGVRPPTCPPMDPCDPEFHRWARADSAPGTITRGDQSNPEIVLVDFWEQLKTHNRIMYDPASGDSGGYVDYIRFRKFSGDSILDDDIYNDSDYVEIWADKGNMAYSSKFVFSDTTTEGWITISPHVFDPFDKTTTNIIKYQRPYLATYAKAILWRRYTLFGVPLYPREDTLRYRNFAVAHGCIDPMTPLDYGEQDIVLYDDMHIPCSDTTDSNCGLWESPGQMYRIMSYYTPEGSYLLYHGPGYPYNPPRFNPGFGFWGNQDLCDSIPFDAFGVVVDSMDSFEMPLGKYDGMNPYTQYNMLGNPFYNADTLIDIPVNPSKWRIKNITRGETQDIASAVASGWIQNPIYVYRRQSASAWAYVPLPVNAVVDTHIHEWEGYWLMTNNTDSMHVIMYCESRSPVSLMRRTAGLGWFVELGCQARDEVDAFNKAGYSRNNVYASFREPAKEMFPPDRPNPMRLFFLDGTNELMSSFVSEERESYRWTVRLEAGEHTAEPVRLFWDISAMPDEYVVILKIPAVGDVDLRSNSEIMLAPTFGKPLDMELYVYPVATLVSADKRHVPDKFFMSSAIPNPFNVTATINFGVPAGHGDMVTVEIIDQQGRLVRTLWNKSTEAGYYSVVWDGKDDAGNIVPAAVYFCRMTHREFTETKRAVLLK